MPLTPRYQTPASRKFVQPSSNSASSAKPGFSSRFLRPSQTPSSSTYTKTPHSSIAPKPSGEEIESDDLDDDDDLVLPPTTRKAQSNNQGSNQRDVIEADDEFDPNEPVLPRDHELAQSTSKRRKISHFNPLSTHEEDLVDSSPPDSTFHELPAPIEDHTTTDHDTDIQILRSSPDPPAPAAARRTSSSPISPTKDLATPKLRTSRFRHVATHPPSQPQSTLPLPSFQSRLLASGTSPGPHIRGPHPALDSVLPDAFSPSRRRGQRGYVHGGAAETVRGWVLDVAARVGAETQEQVTDTAGGNVRDTETVTEVLRRDESGRFVLVRTMRESEERMWMLISAEGEGRNSSWQAREKGAEVEVGREIVVKGGEAMQWGFDLRFAGAYGGGWDGRRECRVAVLWDVLR